MTKGTTSCYSQNMQDLEKKCFNICGRSPILLAALFSTMFHTSYWRRTTTMFTPPSIFVKIMCKVAEHVHYFTFCLHHNKLQILIMLESTPSNVRFLSQVWTSGTVFLRRLSTQNHCWPLLQPWVFRYIEVSHSFWQSLEFDYLCMCSSYLVHCKCESKVNSAGSFIITYILFLYVSCMW